MPRHNGDDEVDTEKLHEYAALAKNYIQSFSWCPPIKDILLAYGVEGIVSVFLVEFVRSIQGTDDKLWLVVGDLPSAYLVVEPNDDESQALERYCELMDQWVDTVRRSGDVSQVFPVMAQPTIEHADMLNRRLEMLRAEIIPQIRRV